MGHSFSNQTNHLPPDMTSHRLLILIIFGIQVVQTHLEKYEIFSQSELSFFRNWVTKVLKIAQNGADNQSLKAHNF